MDGAAAAVTVEDDVLLSQTADPVAHDTAVGFLVFYFHPFSHFCATSVLAFYISAFLSLPITTLNCFYC